MTKEAAPKPERIQKVLARAGLGSRRQVEAWIEQGRIIINGKPATLGDTLSPTDKVIVDGKPFGAHNLKTAETRVLLYHKPVGEVCTRSDPEGRPTVFDRLPKIANARWVSIGRLDINTSGLLLLTNDGELANKLMHPSSEVEREYAVRILGEVGRDTIATLLKGVMLDDGPAKFDQILDSGGTGINHWYHVIIKEGRNREVRRLWESQGLKVSRLQRVRYGSVALPRAIKPGRWDDIEPAALEELRALVK